MVMRICHAPLVFSCAAHSGQEYLGSRVVSCRHPSGIRESDELPFPVVWKWNLPCARAEALLPTVEECSATAACRAGPRGAASSARRGPRKQAR